MVTARSEKMRLEMLVEMQIEILDDCEMLADKLKSRNWTSSVSRGTHSNWDFGLIWIPLYLVIQIRIEIFESHLFGNRL